MKDNYIKLFACCLIVKGAKRATLADIQRNTYIFIPTEIAELLETADQTPIASLMNEFEEEDQAELSKYLEYLVDQEYAFYTTEPEAFPPLSLDWRVPQHITNAIIDYNKDSTYNIRKVVLQLEQLGCQALLLRCYDPVEYAFLESLIFSIEQGEGVLRNVQLIIHFSDAISKEQYITLTERCTRITSILIHHSPDAGNYGSLGRSKMVKYIRQHIPDETHCGFVSPKYFRINSYFFTEAQHFNSCLNKKIAVDVKGNIRNCPAIGSGYGHIDVTTLADVIQQPRFHELGNINKNLIKVCKDCEFRFICTDCRAFVQDTGDIYSKPSKCRYDPYTMEWSSN